jgi:hypothetical protein
LTYSNKTLLIFYFLLPNSPDNACPIFANGFDEFAEVALLAAFVALPAAPPAAVMLPAFVALPAAPPAAAMLPAFVALPPVMLLAAKTEPTNAEVANMTPKVIAKGNPKIYFVCRISA